MIRVMLVDDQELVRSGVRMMLENDAGITIVGEASTGRQALELIPAARPDVVLMDIRMPDGDGIATTRTVMEHPAPPAVVVLTTFDLDEHIFDALDAGARGFLLKDASADALIAAVHAAARGDGVLAPSVTRRVIERHVASTGASCLDPRSERLTSRERDVVAALTNGLSNAEIGATLYVSEATVKSHITSVLTKLALRDRTQIVIWAFRSGLADD